MLNKVIIVDDEFRFRRHLHSAIDWNAYGFEICAEARNGIEALREAETIRPDVALVDINMPFMDGLQLSEKLKEQHPEISIIFITGYSDFEYARKAVKVGAVDYLLKPFNEEELLMVLHKVRASIQKRKEEKNAIVRDTSHQRERLLNLIISNECNATEAEIIKQLHTFGIEIKSQYFTVSSIEIDAMYQRWSDASEILLWKYAVSNILSDVVQTDGKHIVFNGPEGRLISIVQLDEKRQYGDLAHVQDFQKFCNLVQKYIHFTVNVGIGKPAFGFKEIRRSYVESVIALSNKMIIGCGKAIEYSKLESRNVNIGFYPSQINENLLMSLRLNDEEGIQDNLKEVFHFIQERQLSAEFTYMIFMGLISLCLSFIFENGKKVEDVFGQNFSPYSEMKNMKSLDDTYNWISAIFDNILVYSGNHKLSKSRKLLDTAKDYIEKNYRDCNLAVEDIAQKLYINSSYLRKIFKKELDTTVTGYITKIRMQKAKELISEGSMKLSDISEMVGYSYSAYFSTSFKKYYGMSPSEFENSRK